MGKTANNNAPRPYPNLHYAFYKEYFEVNTVEAIRDCNDRILMTTPLDYEDFTKGIPGYSIQSFRMRTTYPGLLIGIGYPHEGHWEKQDKEEENSDNAKKAKDETKTNVAIKLGFMLDYVTGMPVIPGSSVKGVLRSAFRRYADHGENEPGLVREFLKDILEAENAKQIDVEKIDIDLLESEIFDNGDIFFDAVIVRSDSKTVYTKARAKHTIRELKNPDDPFDQEHKIFAFDSITRHPDKIKNPIPIKLLKVLPNVQFQFRFGFQNNSNGVLKETDKMKLFISILETLGIGAKTNTGYGYMLHVDNAE